MKTDELLSFTKSEFSNFKDIRASNTSYNLGDIVQSGLAIFLQKNASLLQFNNMFSTSGSNMLNIYKINKCPEDTQFRSVLDQVIPRQIEKVHRKIIRRLKNNGALKQFEVIKGWKVLLVDGVHHYGSEKVSCPKCLIKNHKDGRVSYSHSMLSSVIASPDLKVVLPLCQEAITKQDGESKNDCELNAAFRLIEKIQTRHLDEKFIFVEDALFANAPHIRAIMEKGNRYIIRVKPGSGAEHVINQFEALKQGNIKLLQNNKPLHKGRQKGDPSIKRPSKKFDLKQVVQQDKKIIKKWEFVEGLELNKANPDVKVSYFRYQEIEKNTGKVKKSFEWISNIKITVANIELMTKIGRSRWKIENETFNTLKNHGYHFEHNFGHGTEYLCNNMALLMMLAFLIDQIQELCNKVFQAALAKQKQKKRFWFKQRAYFETIIFDSAESIYLALIDKPKIEYKSINNSP